MNNEQRKISKSFEKIDKLSTLIESFISDSLDPDSPIYVGEDFLGGKYQITPFELYSSMMIAGARVAERVERFIHKDDEHLVGCCEWIGLQSRMVGEISRLQALRDGDQEEKEEKDMKNRISMDDLLAMSMNQTPN